MSDALHDALVRAAAELRGADRVWIGTHVDPDGDAIGSVLGLGYMLRDMGKTVDMACADRAPSDVSFLPGARRLSRKGPSGQDVWVSLDTADESRLGKHYDAGTWSKARTIVIDHHASNPGFGGLNVIDTTAASTAEIIVDLAATLGVTPNRDAATSLLTGIVTDTLGFRTSNTTPSTLDRAQRLMGWGAPLGEITQQVFYRKPLPSLRLTGRAIQRLETHGPFAISTIRRVDLKEMNAPPNAMRGVTAVLATAAEPAAVALLRERADGSIDVSLRSKPGVDLIPAAVSLGGGGHPQACGARLDGPLETARDRVLGALREHAAPTSAASDESAPPAPERGGPNEGAR